MKGADSGRKKLRPSVVSSEKRRKEKAMKKDNALMKLGRAVSEYLKGKPAPNHNNKQFKPRHSRYQQYREEHKAQCVNGARSQIVNPDGTIITVDVFRRQSAQERRSYRKNERR